jgi:hypothetical protein
MLMMMPDDGDDNDIALYDTHIDDNNVVSS